MKQKVKQSVKQNTGNRGLSRQNGLKSIQRQRSSVVEQRFRKPQDTFNLLNKLTVSQIAALSNLSKAYISQVKNGKRPPSTKLLDSLLGYCQAQKPTRDYYQLFIQSRLAMEVSPTTIRFYQVKLGKFLNELDPDKVNQNHIEKFLLQFDNVGNRHGYYQVIKTFYIWREQIFSLQSPIRNMPAPKLGKLILPSLTQDHVLTLLQEVHNARDKAIIALFTESGLRLSELANIRPHDIDWNAHTIQVIGKGRKEAYAPFGELSERYLKEWLAQNKSNGKLWDINSWGISIMLRRLKARTGLPCNPHTFRRTFACLLRKQGLDCLTIKDLGRWESVEMVQRYTRSVTFQDSLKFYKGVLS